MNDIEIHRICKVYNIRNYTIKDGLVNVNGDVWLADYYLTKLPLKFGEVIGYFKCNDNKLTSLEGCPTYVGGFFNCGYNQLTDLKGCPDEVEGAFYCERNKIYSLEGLLFKRINIRNIKYNPIYDLYCKYQLDDIYHREFLIEADVIRPPEFKGGLPIINKDRMYWFTQTYGLEDFEGDKNYKLEI